MQETPCAPGADLASSDPVAAHAQGERWTRSQLAAAEQQWRRTRPALRLALYAGWACFAVLLWRAGYPRWRALVLVAILGVFLAFHLVRSLGDRLGPLAAAAAASEHRLLLALLLGAMAVTGGLHSPLLVAIPAAASGLVVRCGWSRETAAAFGTLGLAAVGIALAPDRWTGPPPPEPAFTITALVVLVGSVAVHADYVIMLGGTVTASVRAMLRAREEVASHAMARARELELLSSQLSHELKNPLGAIKALVQLSARAATDPDARERLQVVQDEVERMREILDGYLSFSRPCESLRPEVVELDELADDVLAVLQARADAARVSLRRRGGARIEADPRRLKEALFNLVANALEASEPGGWVEVRIRARGEQAELVVADAGRGMSPAVLARLGTPFFTTREHGTGLGVLLARRTFVQHGGTLEYASVPGAGTTATGTLPLTAAQERRSDVGASAAGG